MWPFRQEDKDARELRREVKKLRKLAADKEKEANLLRSNLASLQTKYDEDIRLWSRDLEQAHSTIQIQQDELTQQQAVIKRDRKRVEAELAGHATAIALASIMKQGGHRAAVLNPEQNQRGG